MKQTFDVNVGSSTLKTIEKHIEVLLSSDGASLLFP